MRNRGNVATFYLQAGDEKIAIDTFAIKDWGLTREYSMDIEFNHADDSLSESLPRLLTLHYFSNSKHYVHHGHLTCVTRNTIDSGFHYVLNLTSPLSYFLCGVDNNTFASGSNKSQLEQFLSCHYHSDYELAFTESNSDWRNQHNESNLSFFNRFIARFGLMYSYQQLADSVKLIISQSNQDFSESSPFEMTYSYNSGFSQGQYAYNLDARHKTVTNSINNSAYKRYPAKVSRNILLSTTSSHHGERKIDNLGFDAAALIRTCSDSVAHEVSVSYTDVGLEPAQVIKLQGLDDKDPNHFIHALSIAGFQQQHSGSGDEHLSDDYAKAKLTTRLLLKHQPISLLDPVNTKVVDKGFMTARVESNSDYAELDSNGAYKIRQDYAIPLDRDPGCESAGLAKAHKKAQASGSVPFAQYFTGPGFGMHFPLLDQTEVLLVNENDDIDKPIIIGALNNNLAKSVVTKDNAWQNKWLTKSQNNLLLDDEPSKEKIQLATKDGNNELLLDATKDNHQVSLKSKQGKMTVKAKQSLTLMTESELTVKVKGNSHYRIGNHYHLETKSGDRIVKVKNNHSTRIGKGLRQANENLVMKAKTRVIHSDSSVVNVGGDYSLESGTSIDISVAKGSIYLKAKIYFHLQNKGAYLTMTPGKIAFKCHDLTLKAASIKGMSANSGLGGSSVFDAKDSDNKTSSAASTNNSVTQFDSMKNVTTKKISQGGSSSFDEKTQGDEGNDITQTNDKKFEESVIALEKNLVEYAKEKIDEDYELIRIIGSDFASAIRKYNEYQERVQGNEELPEFDVNVTESEAISHSTNKNGLCWNNENTTTISLNVDVHVAGDVRKNIFDQLKPAQSYQAKIKEFMVSKLSVETSMSTDCNGHVTMSTSLLPNDSSYQYQFNFGIDEKSGLPKLGASVTYSFEKFELETPYGKMTLTGTAMISNDFVPKVRGLCAYAIPTWRALKSHEVLIHGSIAAVATGGALAPIMVAGAAESSTIILNGSRQIGSKLIQYGTAFTAGMSASEYAMANQNKDSHLSVENENKSLTVIFNGYII